MRENLIYIELTYFAWSFRPSILSQRSILILRFIAEKLMIIYISIYILGYVECVVVKVDMMNQAALLVGKVAAK